MAVNGLDEPENHDFGAAADYLSMVAEPDVVDKTVAALRAANLRAGRMALLPAARAHAATGLSKADGKKPSPSLLLRGCGNGTVALQVANGYHRVCASYMTDESTPSPDHLASAGRDRLM